MSELLDPSTCSEGRWLLSIPCKGKHPLIDGWQTKFDVCREDMARWAGANTGILCAYDPVFDLDILHPEAAAEAEHG